MLDFVLGECFNSFNHCSVWVWRFYEVDEMGITRKRSVMLAGDAEEWPTEAQTMLVVTVVAL